MTDYMANSKSSGHGKADEMDNREVQKRFMQFQMARQYLVAMTEEKTVLDGKLAEITMTIASLEGVEKIKAGEEIWSTLGSDVFVMSDIRDASTAIIGVGAGVYVRKPLTEAIGTLKARRDEIAGVGSEMAAQIAALNEQLVRMEPEIQAMAAQVEESEKE